MVTKPRAADDLMSVLGHELRSPLTAIRGAASLLLMAQGELPEPRVAELLKLIDSQAGLMADRIEDVLVSARIEAGELRLVREEVDLGDVVADVLEAARARHRDRRIRAPGVVEGVLVRGDQQRVTQVLRALVSNAVAYSPPAPAPVEVRVNAGPRSARVDVRDRGQGIAAADRNRIFERGARLDRSGAGAGLGLYVAAGLVAAMDGEIGVEPRSGGGSDFWFTLPLAAK
jgi:signal transduction histidine kinase